MKKLYQQDNNGNIKVWEIGIISSKNFVDLVVRSGRLDGKMIETVTRISSGKNLNKTNETTPYEQALSEMQSKIDLKIKKGYVDDLSQILPSSVLGTGIPAPMLAHKYSADGSQSSSKTLKQLGLVGKNIVVQPKLDGNRCLIKVSHGMVTMFTRSGDEMPVQLDHIVKDILGKATENDDLFLDGELFSKKISFNTLNGLIKRVKATPEELEKRKLIKYHLYDIVLNRGYEIRCKLIERFASDNILIVPSKMIVATDENLLVEFEKFISDGEEGLIIRTLNQPYENKRSWNLLKMKSFCDDEYKLVDMIEDSRGGFAGSFVMENKDGTTFNIGCSGQSVTERVEMWNNPDDYLGKMVTVQYFNLSEYGVPRFGKLKGIR